MDRDEFEFHMSLMRKGAFAGTGMLICGALLLIFGHHSAKGFITIGLWMALATYGTAKAIHVLRIGRNMENSGQIDDHRISDWT
jgi:hypothetical protein